MGTPSFFHAHPNMSSRVVDQYNTPVVVEVYMDGQLRNVKCHSDLQIAWFWCFEEADRIQNGPWYTNFNSMQQLAAKMNRRWRQDRRGGIRVFYSQTCDMVVFYEPSEDS